MTEADISLKNMTFPSLGTGETAGVEQVLILRGATDPVIGRDRFAYCKAASMQIAAIGGKQDSTTGSTATMSCRRNSL
jgi:hypothetical protein